MKLRINNIVRSYGNICIELVKIGESLEVDNTEDKSYRINTKFFMSKIITHDEYIEIVKNNNKYVDIIGIYNGMRNKILCRCKICGEEYEIQKEHDRRKRDYAKNNGYTLIEIWYWEYDNINEILERRLY